MQIKRCPVVVAALALAVVLTVGSCTSMHAWAKDAQLARMQASPQYRDGRFVNPLPVRNGLNGEGHVSWNLARRWMTGGEIRIPEQTLPVVQRHRADFAPPARDGLRLTWLGHSSVLIEIDGYRVLTDPVWAANVSPLSLDERLLGDFASDLSNVAVCIGPANLIFAEKGGLRDFTRLDGGHGGTYDAQRPR